MDDDKLRELFDIFEPELTPDRQFMQRLQQNLDSVEMVRLHNERLKSRNKKAVWIAACAGFVAGSLFSWHPHTLYRPS